MHVNVVLCHRLLRTDRSASSEHSAENLAWEEVHRSFHRALHAHYRLTADLPMREA